jgi:hypothetical protein
VRQAAKALNIRRGAGFQPAGTPALPARGLLHGWRSSRNRRGQKTNQPLVAQPLVVPFETAMGKEFVDRLPQGAFSERDHPVQAGFLDGSDKAFRVGIQIRQTGRPPQPARPNAGTVTPSRWSSGCTLARFQAVFLDSGNQLPAPSQQRLRGNYCGNLMKDSTAKLFGLGGQAPALAVAQRESFVRGFDSPPRFPDVLSSPRGWRLPKTEV